MNEEPLVCICVPTYNAASTVREMLLSVLSQSYKNLIVHVSDNASTDDTIKVIEGICDPRVRVHKLKMNVGGEENFNQCIRLAEGKYTAIFHADDVYEPHMIEQQVLLLENFEKVAAVFTEANVIDENGRIIGDIRFPKSLAPFNRVYDFKTMVKAVLRHSNFLVCPSVLVRTEVYKHDIKRWRGDMFRTSADLDVWFRIALKYPIALLPKALLRYRISDKQGSSLVRSQTDRADFFLVLDHYLAQEDVRAFLEPVDLENYRKLDRRDRVMRSVNFFLKGRSDEARILLLGVFSWEACTAAVRSKRGFLVLIAGVYMQVLLLLRLQKVGVFTLRYLKSRMRR